MAENVYTEKDMRDLEIYLESLRQEELQVLKRLNKYMEDAEIHPPTVDELQGVLTQEQKDSISVWQDEVKKAVEKCKAIMNTMRKKVVKNENIRRDDWLDAGLEIASLSLMVDQDRVYKDQLYRAKLTSIIDCYGTSRKEAEERAKLTKEYRDYKIAILFRDNLNEFIMLTKKYSDVGF